MTAQISPRSAFDTIRSLSAARNGGQNCGVYLVKSKRSDTKYIEKRVNRRSIQEGYAQREVQAMFQCRNSPHIICIETWDLDYCRLGYGSIFMQRCELGSLDLLIERYARRRERLGDAGFLWKVIWDLSLALCFLWIGTDAVTTRNRAAMGRSISVQPHWNHILHRDLKPANIFLTWSNRMEADGCSFPTIVVGDLGCSVTDTDIRAGRAHPH
ncbi:kinase-like domain-containing protein [Pyrenochaeta sp. MPI-SDFR-AT-0127]|nr:kinase-like domain-containing protein [Pyrenochaeta sp. MPI-SDFR-AT-0127]